MSNFKKYVVAFFMVLCLTGISRADELYNIKSSSTPIYSAPNVKSTVRGTAKSGTPLINIGGHELKNAGHSYVYILTKNGGTGWVEVSSLKDGRSIKSGNLYEYGNSKYSYAIKIPKDFKSSGKTTPGDGRTFTRGAVQIIVYGSYDMMVLDHSLKDKAAETLKDFSTTDINVIADNWYLLRGKRGGKTVWEKCFYIEEDERDITVQISYPSDKEEENIATVGIVLAPFKGL